MRVYHKLITMSTKNVSISNIIIKNNKDRHHFGSALVVYPLYLILSKTSRESNGIASIDDTT